MAAGRVLKNLLLVSALAGALVSGAPAQAGDGHHRDRHGYDHGGDRGGGHGSGWGRGNGWGGHGHHGNHWGGHRYGHHGYGHGWGRGYQPYGYYAPPRPYYQPYHNHYRGCGHDGYGGGLVEFLIDYSRYDD